MTSESKGVLTGLVVVERAGRLATAACASLLANLGARVLRIESKEEQTLVPRLPFPEQLLRTGTKERVHLEGNPTEREGQWRHLLARADVLIFDPRADDEDGAFFQSVVRDPPQNTVVCAISPVGLSGEGLPIDASDAFVQAVSGLMALTGKQGGRPELVKVPVAELSAAVLATTAILSGLRARDRDGAGQVIDLSLFEVLKDQIRTSLPQILDGKPRGHRMGCRSPIGSPWNVYQAKDGWVLICALSNARWHGILDIIGRSDLKSDMRYSSAHLRLERADEVDQIVQEWVRERTIEEAVTIFSAGDIPVGPAFSISQVLSDETLRKTGTVRSVNGCFAPGPAWHLSRTPMRLSTKLTVVDKTIPGNLPVINKRAQKQLKQKAPLDGVRVVELTTYTAGALAGLVLRCLGAEVIKIEMPKGEECRTWQPQFGGVSGYFVNYNAGKRSVTLDLREAEAQEHLNGLIASADIVLHNLRPGSMERLGFGAEEVTTRYPRIVYGVISGFGVRGPALAAFDTIMQARLGLTALVGDGSEPLRMGFSVADQLSGHFMAAGILSALAERERSGRGQIVSVAMIDAVAWLTQIAWDNNKPGIAPTTQLETSDGWVVANASAEVVTRTLGNSLSKKSLSRTDLVAILAAQGIKAVPVLEADEVLEQPLMRARGSLYSLQTYDGGTAPTLAMPLGLTSTPPLRPQRMHRLGEDNTSLLRTYP